MDRRHYQTRLATLGEPEDETYLSTLSAAERMEMVWTLTLQAWAFHEELRDEPRLRRDVGRVIRGRG